MSPRASSRLGVAAAIPALVLVPVLHVPTTPGPLAAVAAPAYDPPVPGQVARGFDPPAREWEAGHRGVDLWSSRGAEVRSPGRGVVTFAGSVAGKPVVVVTHPDGLRSTLEPVEGSVQRGTAVGRGDVVGHLSVTSGDESNPDHCAARSRSADAACLHWGVRRGDLYLDPLTLLDEAPPIVLLPPL